MTPATAPLPEMGLQLLAAALLLAAGALAVRSMRLAGETIEALRRSDARHRAIIDGAGEAIMVIDDQAIIQIFNRAAERMFGYPAEEIASAPAWNG